MAALKALPVAVLLLGLFLWPASAHSVFVESDPPDGSRVSEPVTEITVSFSQELTVGESTFEVIAASGEPIEGTSGVVDLDDLDRQTLASRFSTPLRPGTYTVRWTVLSAADDDVTSGEFEFEVVAGAATTTSPPPATLNPPDSTTTTSAPTASTTDRPSATTTTLTADPPAAAESSGGFGSTLLIAGTGLLAIGVLTAAWRRRPGRRSR